MIQVVFLASRWPALDWPPIDPPPHRTNARELLRPRTGPFRLERADWLFAARLHPLLRAACHSWRPRAKWYPRFLRGLHRPEEQVARPTVGLTARSRPALPGARRQPADPFRQSPGGSTEPAPPARTAA